MKQVGTILALALALAAVACRADRIVFKNGRSLECTILAEEADHVAISIGGGQMNIPRSQLEKVIKTGTAATAPTPQASLSGLLNTVPPEHAEIASKFRQLLQLRNAATDAQYMAARHEEQLQKLEQRQIQLRQAFAETARLTEEKNRQAAAVVLPEYNPYDNTTAMRYRRMVEEKVKLQEEADTLFGQMSQLATQGDEARQQHQKIRQEFKSDHQPVVTYRQALDRFATEFDAHKGRFPAPGAQTAALFAMLDRHVVRFRQELPANKIDFRIRGNATIVRVLVNDTLSGEFVLDTGAEIMTIRESFAQRLGMRLEDLPISDGILADGSVIDIRQATLQSVAVGYAKVEGVRCAVVKNALDADLDGLLGMSFLKYFSVHHNVANGELVFSRFSPQE